MYGWGYNIHTVHTLHMHSMRMIAVQKRIYESGGLLPHLEEFATPGSAWDNKNAHFEFFRPYLRRRPTEWACDGELGSRTDLRVKNVPV